jgi:hypothetical protein
VRLYTVDHYLNHQLLSTAGSNEDFEKAWIFNIMRCIVTLYHRPLWISVWSCTPCPPLLSTLVSSYSLWSGSLQSVPSTGHFWWVLIPLINQPVLSGCIKDIYKWSRELARNVLEFCWHSISLILRKVLQHAVQSYDVGLLALLTIRRKVCCGFLSPLKIHRIGQAWTYVLSVQWQAHWSHHQGGSYSSDQYHSMVDCGYSISLCILTFHHNALQDRLTAATYLALCRDSSFKISIYAMTFHVGRKKFCLMPWLKSYLFPEYIQFETCETEQIGIVLML